MARLTKDGISWEVTDPIHIQAFLNEGWVVEKKATKKTVEEPKEEEQPAQAPTMEKKAGRPPKK